MKRNKLDLVCLRAVEFQPTTATRDGEDEAANDGSTLFGYAAVFDTDTEINSWEGYFKERISQGAFRKTLKEQKPVLQFDHGHDARMGTVPIGKFTEIKEDERGLYVEAELFDNDAVKPIRQAIAGEAITGMSFRFSVTRDEWHDKNGKKITRREDLYKILWDPESELGPLQRTIKEVKLMEAGPVVFPAYKQTSVGVRSIEEQSERLLDLNDEETRDAIVDEYTRLSDLEFETPEDADPKDEPTAPEVRADETKGVTSEGHEDKKPTETRKAKPREVIKLPETKQRKESVPMRTVAEMRTRLAEIAARMTEMDEEFRDSELPSESQTEWDGLATEGKELRTAIERAETRAASLRDFAIAEPESREKGSDTGRRAPAVHVKKSESEMYGEEALRSLRADSVSPEDYAAKVKDNALRIAESIRIPLSVDRDSARAEIDTLLRDFDTDEGDLAKRVTLTGSTEYERAFGKALRALSTAPLTAEEQRALAVGADATGGYAVPAQLDPTIIMTNNGVINPIRQLARTVKIVGNKWQGISSAGITVSRDAEAEEVSDDSPSLARPEVSPTRVAGFVPFSVEIDQDWGQLRNEITTMLAEAKDDEESAAFIQGDGTGNNPFGVVATLTGNTVTAGGTAAFAAADVYALTDALAPRYRANASFLANGVIYNKVRQFDTSGGAQLWERIGADRPGQLLGRPALEASAMASVLTTGSKIMLYGDFRRGFIIVDRVGMSIELVPHLFGANRRPTGQRGIHALWRNGSKVLVPAAFKLLVTG